MCPRLAMRITAALCGMLVACEGSTPGSMQPRDGAVDGSVGDAGATGDGTSCDAFGAAVGWQRSDPSEWVADASAQDIAAAGEQTWAIALDLLNAVEVTTMPSVAHSPTSMFAAMGLSYGRFQSEPCGERILSVMRYPQSGDALHRTLGASLLELESRALPQDEGNPALAVSLRQSSWSFDGALGASTARDSLYGTLRNAVDRPSPEARDLINCVIEEQSKGLLKDFVPEGKPAYDTTAYDVNVAYLTAPWATAMSARGMLEFSTEAGATVQLPRIVGDVQASGYEGETFATLDVPLRGSQLSILFVRPAGDYSDGLQAFANSLTPEQLRQARDSEAFTFTTFSMPKVAVPSVTLDYNAGATSLGFGCEKFTLRDVLHGATVEIDDKGIKASAATAAEEWGDSAPASPDVFFDLDRPFLFFVHDHQTHYVLYSGRYMGPE